MINLRQMAQDEIIFRFESNADKREFWELYIKNSGDRYNNHISNFAKLWRCEDGKLYIDNYKYNLTHEYYPTWTEIKDLTNSM